MAESHSSSPSRELAEKRQALAPDIENAFRAAFSRTVSRTAMTTLLSWHN